jgi:divalent metal cation (Fe/Co/Zn/Cd) transporter
VTTVATGRDELLVRAQRLGAFTVVWNLGEGGVAIAAAWIAGSGALTGFGVDSVVESASATVLLWRLGAERRDGERAERAERLAARGIGASLLALAVLVAYEAVRSLALHEQPQVSVIGIAVTAASLVVMPLLAQRKRRVAIALGSRAAEADSAQTRACAWLSAVVLTGLVLNAAFSWWWADPVAALAVVFFLLREGREALTSENVDDCC